MIKQFDEDKSGNLNAQELARFIKAYSDARQWTAEPVFPTEEEMNLILQAAGKQKANCVDESEIQFALDLWHSYITNRQKIEQVFSKYDTNGSKKLEFDQLVRYLTDLNEGHAPKALHFRLSVLNHPLTDPPTGRRGADYHAGGECRRRD